MRRSRDRDALDPFENPGAARGGVASVLAGARASLVNPSRPYTPADALRPLFAGSDYSSRPSSAYSTSELRQGLDSAGSSSDVYGSVEFDSVRASDEFAGASRMPFAAVNGMRPDGMRPDSSHGTRERAPRGPPQVGSQSIEFPAETPEQPTELPLPMEDDGRSGPSGGGAATAALVAELDLPGANRLKLCDDLWHHVTSVEYRDDQAAGLPVERIVVGRLSRLTEEHSGDAKTLLAIGRVLLQAISRRGSGLQSTCRMLYKLSKDEKNDELFNAAHIIEPLVSLVIREAADIGGDAAAAAAPPSKSGKRQVTACDILVYAIGTLKNVSHQSQENQKRLGQKGVFAAMAEVLTSAAAGADLAAAPGSPAPSTAAAKVWTDRQAQVLVQATATLRNMAVLSAHRRQFVTFEMVQKLCAIMCTKGAVEHAELMLNISRTLSKLTLHEDCRVPMYEKPTVQALLRILREHETNHDLVLRTSFILGNLTTTQDDCRNFVLETPGALEQLLSLLGQLVESSCSGPGDPPPVVDAPSTDGSGEGSGASSGKVAQVSKIDATLVKVIRLVANLAINEELGMMVSQDPSAMLLCRVIEAKPVADHEELVLNAVSAITNLSFYQQPLNSVLNHELIATLLVPLLLHENHEAKVESARCYGNLSRYPEIRRLMKSKRVDEMLCILLDHPQQSVLTAVCGVLMNIAADGAFRRSLREMHIAQKLMAVLEQLALQLADLPLATLLCKTFFNLSIGMDGDADSAVMSLGECEMLQEMIEMLLEQCAEPEFSAEVSAEGGEDGAESLRVCLAVGRALNERLTASLQETAAPSRPATDPSDLVPLPMPPGEEGEDDGVGVGGAEDPVAAPVAAVAQEEVESSDEELPVGEVDAAADAMAARQKRIETFGASC